ALSSWFLRGGGGEARGTAGGVKLEREPRHEIAAVLIVRDLCAVAAEEGIAIRRERRVGVGGHVARVAAQCHMAAHGVLDASAQAVGKVGAGRIATAVELVREAQASGRIGTKAVLVAQKHEQQAKLILVYVGVIGLEKRLAG